MVMPIEDISSMTAHDRQQGRVLASTLLPYNSDLLMLKSKKIDQIV